MKPATRAIKPFVTIGVVVRTCFENVILLSRHGSELSRVNATPVGLM